MIEKLKQIFAGRAEPTSSAILALADEARAARGIAGDELSGLKDKRADALLVADTKTIRALESEIAAKELELERLDAALVKLSERLEAAERREREESLRAKKGRAAALSDEGVQILRDFEIAIAEWGPKLARLAAIEEAVRDSTAAAAELGEPAVMGPSRRVRGQSGHFIQAEVETRLPDLSHGMGLAWPPTRQEHRESALEATRELRVIA